jgi:hypothetical protein
MTCVQTGESAESCSRLVLRFVPLSFWRNATAEVARACLGVFFVMVEIIKGYLALTVHVS